MIATLSPHFPGPVASAPVEAVDAADVAAVRAEWIDFLDGAIIVGALVVSGIASGKAQV